MQDVITYKSIIVTAPTVGLCFPELVLINSL